jgi:hypothetical protein
MHLGVYYCVTTTIKINSNIVLKLNFFGKLNTNCFGKLKTLELCLQYLQDYFVVQMGLQCTSLVLLEIKLGRQWWLPRETCKLQLSLHTCLVRAWQAACRQAAISAPRDQNRTPRSAAWAQAALLVLQANMPPSVLWCRGWVIRRWRATPLTSSMK